MLIDEARITVKAGNGGDGIVHFYSDRWRPKGGPDGGDGGNGGSVYFCGVNDISRLHQFRHQIKFLAENGHLGGANQKTGKNGKDLILDIPVGTLIHFDNGSQIEIEKIGQTVMAARGGKGGIGNFRLRSSTNQTPREFRPGQTTDAKNLFLELKLIADIGLIGLPNVGKTSLLNELTAASAKVANYPFTTLEPNLGVTPAGHIIADIPGLIEGAAAGKGLGIKFLKHIERTKLLLHCLSAESPDFQKDYQVVRRELSEYSSRLAKKPELIIITKSDLLPAPIKNFKHHLVVSIADSPSLKQLLRLINSKISLLSPNHL